MNFLNDKDGVTAKDVAFISIMSITTIITSLILFMIFHAYFTKSFSDTDIIELIKMVFVNYARLLLIVITYFYGTKFAVSILNKNVSKIANDILNDVTNSETSYDNSYETSVNNESEEFRE